MSKKTRALTSAIGRKFCPKSKRSQEEMVGFALIVIIVAVVLLVFLSFSLRNEQKETVDSYEVDNFIQVFLQYTTDCAEISESNYLSIQDLIFNCYNRETCLDEKEACEVLETTLKEIVEVSWEVGEGEETPIKGYLLNISSDGVGIIPSIEKGENTRNYKSSSEHFSSGIDIYFTAYY
ncbi:MAG: hypothetical protein HQ557_08870 [Bacteroidetes bacterium]|nr:hypothetical protein [Bacteroidota bacterium]